MSPVQQERKKQVIAELKQIAGALAALRAPLRNCAESLKTLDDYVLGVNLLEGDAALDRLARGIAASADKARANLITDVARAEQERP